MATTSYTLTSLMTLRFCFTLYFISNEVIKTTGDNRDFGRVKHCHNIGDSNPRTGVDDRFVRGERRAVSGDAGRQLIKLVLTVVGSVRPPSPTP